MQPSDLGAGCVYKEVIYKMNIKYNYTIQALKVLFDLQKVPSESNYVWQQNSFISINLLQGKLLKKKNKSYFKVSLINRLKKLTVRMPWYLSFLVFASQSNAKTTLYMKAV